MSGGKLRQIPTRAFGAEPGIPDIRELAGWVAERRGMQGDLTTYLLARSLSPQKETAITAPCAGGKFYRNRLIGCLLGLDADTVVAEIGVDAEPVIADAIETTKALRGVSVAMPAPHLLGITDSYYHDDDEWVHAIAGAYRTLMRSMRDAGCGGHVLICDHIDEQETEALAGRKVFFFHPAPGREDLEILLEHQRQVAVPRQDVKTVISLAEEYEISGIVIMDPDDTAIRAALESLDLSRITAGGYCTSDCTAYWQDLKASAVCRI